MRIILYLFAFISIIVSCKNQITHNKSGNESTKNKQFEAQLTIDSTIYPIDSLSCTTGIKKQNLNLIVYITEAIRKEKPDFEIDYSYIEINCELKEGEHYFTETGESKLPYMKAVIKHTKEALQTNTHRKDKEGVYNKIAINNYNETDQTFDLSCFFNFRIYGYKPPKKIQLELKGINH